MDIDLPKYHNLQNCPDLKETGNYLRTWEISVPVVDSLEWSVVISHLMSANLGNDEDFKNRLEDLTDKHEDMHQIKDCISGFNPFLNRFSCFYDKSLQKIVLAFKEKLKKVEKQDSSIQNVKLEESSKFLKSYILLIFTTETGDIDLNQIESFPKNSVFSSSSPRMTLYCHQKTDTQDCKYSFGLKKERGNQLKMATFKKILKEANIKKQKRKALSSLDQKGESFVTSVLKSEHKFSIPHLYKSSYLAWKLVEAGYEMDPRERDSDGFSAFYHALVTKDETLVYVLYNYAANACHETDKTFRNPDEFIQSNLVNLGAILESDKTNSNDFQALNENSITVRHSANQLIRFNDFLTKMCKNILEEQNKCHDISSRSFSETITRKNVILALLETYDSFFFFDEDQVSRDYFLRLNDYCTYNNYYRNLDYSATLFFFDNIFSLKERLQLNNNEYSDLESSFFLSVLSSKYFSCEFLKSMFPLHKSSLYRKSFNDYRGSLQKDKDLRIIPLIERLRLREEMRSFKNTLLQVEINNNIVSRLPEEEIPKTLSSLPEVKDELEIHRLMHYLETAMKRNVVSSKQVLAIERALQVLGECMVNGRKYPKSLCFLLSVCLPEQTFIIIKQTRNILSHLKEYAFAPKFKAEKNTSLFRDIQKDIKEIYEIFQSIFDIQQLRLAEFLFKRGLQEINKSSSIITTSDYKEVLSRLHEEYNMLCEIKSKPCYNNPVFKNINVLTNIRTITAKKIKNISEESTPETIEEILWPLRYLLTLIAKDCQDLNFSDVQKFIWQSDNLHSCGPHEIKEKMEEFWRNYEKLISELCMKSDNQNTENPPKNLQAEKTVAINIERFKKMMKGYKYFSNADKEDIRSKIPQEVQDSINLKHGIQRVFESRGQLSLEQIKKFPTLFLSKTNLKILKKTYKTDIEKALEAVKTASDPVKELNALLDGSNRTMKKDAFDQLCDRLQFPGDIRKTLLEMDLGQKQFASENNLSNILNRIKLLRQILIEENPNICELWHKAKGVKTQRFAKYKIVQRYIRDPEVQASVETLLFDCMVLLGSEAGIENLWVKASSLYSGINLRNVLGHGNPTLETVGKLLDPDDLPSVLVEEMLQLIKDEEIMQAMYDLCVKTRSDFDNFHKIMNDEDDIEHAEICGQIRNCERWKRYSKLLPRNIRNSTFPSNTNHSLSADYED